MAVLGPMEQSDLVGLDLTLDIHETLIQHLDRTAGPHPYLRSKVAEGKFEMKTGEGFRHWTQSRQTRSANACAVFSGSGKGTQIA